MCILGNIKGGPKGVYYRASEALSKGWVALWVHFFVAIEGIQQNGKGVSLVFTKFKHA